MMGAILRVPIVRTIVFWDLYWDFFDLGKLNPKPWVLLPPVTVYVRGPIKGYV